MAHPNNIHRAGAPLRLGSSLLFAFGIIGLGGCAGPSQIPESQPDTIATAVAPGERPDRDRVTELQRALADRGDRVVPVVLELEPPEAAIGADDLWGRVRTGFQLESHAERPAVENAIQALSSQSNYLGVIARRGRPYLPFIVDEIESRGLPTELVLVPMVESAFEPYAFSHGRAAGIWQFIPSTGRRLGLKQNRWYDGRRDIYASTQAAMDYLSRLNEMFDGDWLLAFAAYNAGQGRVRRAIRAAEEAGEGTDFWSIAHRLPSETRHYVPRILALREFIVDPDSHGQNLPGIPDEPYFTRVDVDGPLDLTLAADLAGISPQELLILNPGFQRGMTDPDGPHHLLVPTDQAEQFKEQLAEVPENERVNWLPHEVQQGETLGEIALAYNVSVDEIQAANDINSHVIRAGDTLRIPTASSELESDVAAMRILHQVEPGENLWLIAREHEVSVEDIASWNGLEKDSTLHPGQELVIRSQTGGGQMQEQVFQPPRQRVFYRVRSGDSLHLIAQRFGVTVEEIRQWNDLSPQGHIHPGETLRIQADITAITEGS